MRKVLKWIGIVLGSLLGLVAILLVGLILYGSLKFKPAHSNRAVYPITADTSPEGLARGKYLLESATGCAGGCHSGGGQPFAGDVQQIHTGPISAVFAVPNLTPDLETGLGSWTDAEIARAIREGVDRNGVELAIMPSSNFHAMGDADVSAIIGYLRSLAPVKKTIPPLQMNAPGKVLMALGIFGPRSLGEPISAPQPAPPLGTAEYGRYEVSIGSCRDCHGQNLAGNTNPNGPPPGPNLTPGGDLASWTEQDFLTALHTGATPSGYNLNTNMPWKEYGKMTDDDLKAIFLYLKSLPPVQLKK